MGNQNNMDMFTLFLTMAKRYADDIASQGTGSSSLSPEQEAILNQASIWLDGQDEGTIKSVRELSEFKASVDAALSVLHNYDDTELREDVANKSNKTVISSVTDVSGELVLTHNTEFRGGEFTSYEWSLPSEIPSDYLCGVIFTSGDTATNLTLPDNIIWFGEDCADGNPFVPISNKRYEVIFEYDETHVIATVRGYGI